MHQTCIESAVRSIRTYFKKCVSPIGCRCALHYLEGSESGFEFSLDNVSYRVGHNVSALYTSSPTRIDHGVYRYSVYYQGCYGDERAATPPTPKRRILIWRHQQKRRLRKREREKEREHFSSLFLQAAAGKKRKFSRAQQRQKSPSFERSLPYYLNPFLYAEKIPPRARAWRLSFFLELLLGRARCIFLPYFLYAA
jgi:hypothetical protein